MNRKILALIVATVAVAGTGGMIAYHIFQTKNVAKQFRYTVTINYYCETVPNENGVIRVIGTVTTNYNFYNVTFNVNGYDFYLRYENRGGYNQPDTPQISMITEGGTGGIQIMTLYNNSEFGGLYFNATGNPSGYFLVFNGEDGGTVIANNGVPCTLELVDQTQ
jgi:hypothetical protein